jgi:hypothetical protein
VIKKRIFGISRDIRILFLLQALVFSSAGSVLFLVLVSNNRKWYLSAVDDLVLAFCAAAMLTFGYGSSIAARSRSWRDVKLLIQMQIAFYTTATLVLMVVMFIGGVAAASLVSILACVGIGGVWIGIYFKSRKEVKGPGINIKEF